MKQINMCPFIASKECDIPPCNTCFMSNCPENPYNKITGKWIMRQDGTGVCSNCHKQDHIDPLAKYCRYCGVRMELEAQKDV